MKSLYTLTNVTQKYNGRSVLNLASIDINKGEILALVGPSGAGKSTLLRLLNFLESPTTGDIQFEGNPANGHLPLATRRRITTVFQNPCLLNRSVMANVRYGLNLRGDKIATEDIETLLKRLGLEGFSGQRATKLSAGEAQRVALARALVLRPDVLLLDEPTANLDPYNVGLMEKIVAEENQQNGTTVVLVTHNVFQAKRLAHRTALLLNGRLVELTDTDTFFTNPVREETAAFVRGDLIY
ncbi:MAG: phosphate ABC transporter ATP-binding protein [Chloroflexi bacterium]|nr:MAG: phosphate ABC transporter ATP-binding protein [Chloroflexota bacterium]